MEGIGAGQEQHRKAIWMEVRVASVILNRYRILEQLGEGGFATVYKAYDQQLDRDVALKLVKASSAQSTDFARFEREAKLLSQLRHKNIISVLAFHFEEGLPPFIVMEYVSGSTIRSILNNNGKLGTNLIYKILLQLCDGLSYAHKLGLVHRDLSAANIILENADSEEPLIRIIDFGLSKLFAGDLNAIKTLTETGLLIGNPHYMSPEAVKGSKQDGRSDIYSLGCLLYECLSGNTMVEADNAAVLFYFQERVYPKEPNIDPKDPLAEILSAITLRCIQKDPEKRFQNCDEILETLRAPQATQKLAKWKDLDPWDTSDESSRKNKPSAQTILSGLIPIGATVTLLILAIIFADQLLVFLADSSSKIGGPELEAPFAHVLVEQKKSAMAKTMLHAATENYTNRGETKKALDSSLLLCKIVLEENDSSEFLDGITRSLKLANSLTDTKTKTQVITTEILPLIERGQKHLQITPKLIGVQQHAFVLLLENRALVKRAILRSAFDSLINSINKMPNGVKVDEPDQLVETICSYLRYAKPHLDTTHHGALNGLCYESRLPVRAEMHFWKCRCEAAIFTGEKRSALWTNYAERKFMLSGDRSFETVNTAWTVSQSDPRVDDGTLRALRELQSDIAMSNGKWELALDYCEKALKYAERHKHEVFINASKLLCFYNLHDKEKLETGTRKLIADVMGGTIQNPGLPDSEYPSDYFDGEKGEEKFFEYAELVSTLVQTSQLDRARFVLRKLDEIVTAKNWHVTEAQKSQLMLLKFIYTPPDVIKMAEQIVERK